MCVLRTECEVRITVPFLENVSWAFARMDPVNVSAEYEVRDFTRL